MPEPTPWWQYLEDAGYAAGIAGKDINQSEYWSEAWQSPGQNLPMYIMAGWVAGRAVRRAGAEADANSTLPEPTRYRRPYERREPSEPSLYERERRSMWWTTPP